MGLDDFKNSSISKSSNKAFNYKKLDEKLESIVEQCQKQFPEKVEIDFIEASPKLKKHAGKAYRDQNIEDGRLEYSIYIRIKKSLAERGGDDLVMVVLHEMCHCYLYQHGIGASEKDVVFQWLCGRVVADPSGLFRGDKEYDKIIKPFIEQDLPEIDQ